MVLSCSTLDKEKEAKKVMVINAVEVKVSAAIFKINLFYQQEDNTGRAKHKMCKIQNHQVNLKQDGSYNGLENSCSFIQYRYKMITLNKISFVQKYTIVNMLYHTHFTKYTYKMYKNVLDHVIYTAFIF